MNIFTNANIKYLLLIIFLSISFFVSDLRAEDIKKHPIGDNTYVDVYTFISNYLKEEKDKMPLDVEMYYEQEKKLLGDKNYKNHYAHMYEGELPGLLKLILKAKTDYFDITLYAANGVGIATSGLAEEVEFANRPIDFSIGILSSKILSGPLKYVYVNNNHTYIEIIRPIYKKNTNHNDFYTYTDTYISKNKEDESDSLLGYVSYIYKK